MTAIALVTASLSCGGDVAGPAGARVASVTVSPTSTSLAIGATLPLQVTTFDADGNILSGRRVFFATNDQNVATVSDDGIVTARAIGTAQIAVSSEGQSAISVVNVTQRPVAMVTVLPATSQTSIGNTVQLSAATYDSDGNLLANRTVLWSSSNESVAIVDAQGLVRGSGLGSATIGATSEGKTGSATVSVQLLPVASVTVAPPTVTLGPGQQAQLVATPRDLSGNELFGRAVNWSSNANSVASVSSTGLVTAGAAGSAVITADIEGKTATSLVTVTGVVPPAPVIDRVTISPKDWTARIGQTKQFVAKAFDHNNVEIPNVTFAWTSSNILRATVSQTGLVLALLKGDVDIRASAGGKSAKADVKVE